MKKLILVFSLIVLCLGFLGCPEKETIEFEFPGTYQGETTDSFEFVTMPESELPNCSCCGREVDGWTEFVLQVEDPKSKKDDLIVCQACVYDVVEFLLKKKEVTWQQGRAWLKDRGWRIFLWEWKDGTIEITARKNDKYSKTEIETGHEKTDLKALLKVIQLIKDYEKEKE